MGAVLCMQTYILLSGVYVAPRVATAKTTMGRRTDKGQDIRQRQTLS